MSNASAELVRWLKFNAVGAIGIAVQLAVLAILKSGMHVNYLVAAALAVETAVLHNFVWHEHYTWADRPASSSIRRLMRFNLSNGAISIAGNIAFMKILVAALAVNYFVANLASIAGCSLLNFVVSNWFVFTAGRSPQCMCACRSTDQISSGFVSNG